MSHDDACIIHGGHVWIARSPGNSLTRDGGPTRIAQRRNQAGRVVHDGQATVGGGEDHGGDFATTRSGAPVGAVSTRGEGGRDQGEKYGNEETPGLQHGVSRGDMRLAALRGIEGDGSAGGASASLLRALLSENRNQRADHDTTCVVS